MIRGAAALLVLAALPGKLSPETVRGLREHEALAREAKGSPELACRLVADTVALDARLDREVRLEERERLRVTGLYAESNDAFTRTGVDFRRLAAHVDPEDVALLRALGELEGTWKGISNVPGWISAVNDLGGCHAPSAAAQALADLAAAWSAARPCLREAVKGRMEGDLKEMASDGNFCEEPRPKRLAAARRNAALLRKLAGTRGPALADELERTARRSTDAPPRAPG